MLQQNHLSKSSTDPDILVANNGTGDTTAAVAGQAVLEFNFPRLNYSPSRKTSSSQYTLGFRPFQSSMTGYVHGNGVGAMPGVGAAVPMVGGGAPGSSGASGTMNGVRTLQARRALPTPGHSELEGLRGGGRQLPSLASAQQRGDVGFAGRGPAPDGYGLSTSGGHHGAPGLRGYTADDDYEEDWC